MSTFWHKLSRRRIDFALPHQLHEECSWSHILDDVDWTLMGCNTMGSILSGKSTEQFLVNAQFLSDTARRGYFVRT